MSELFVIVCFILGLCVAAIVVLLVCGSSMSKDIEELQKGLHFTDDRYDRIRRKMFSEFDRIEKRISNLEKEDNNG